MAAQSLLALRVEDLVEPRFPGGYWAVLHPLLRQVKARVRHHRNKVQKWHGLTMFPPRGKKHQRSTTLKVIMQMGMTWIMPRQLEATTLRQ